MRAGAHPPVRPGNAPGRRLTYWQRRYVLKHYRWCSDGMLARGAGVGPAVVRAYLVSLNAVRTTADERRIARRDETELPLLVTPQVALARLTHVQTRPLTGLDAVLLAGMFLASLVLYAVTAARTVTGEDAGELLAAAHGLGVPHPPGYPLWLLLSWTFDHGLPWGTVAWRVSLVSGVFSALANVCLLALCLKTLRSRVVALAGAALFGVSLTHWTQAVIPEVYGLNTFFVALTALLLVRLKDGASPRWVLPQGTSSRGVSTRRVVGLAAVVGLACTNHPTAIPVAGVALGAAFLIAPRLLRRPLVVGGVLLAFIAPLALYLILPWASSREPYLDWGNPEGPSALWAHVSRAQYASVETVRQVRDSYGDYLQRLQILAGTMGRQFGSPWLLVLGLVGFFALLFRQTGLWVFLVLVGWLCSVGITRFTHYSFDREHVWANQIFFIPAWLTLSWLIAGGMDVMVAALRKVRLRRQRLGLLPGVASLACLAVVALPAMAHFDRADRSHTTLVADYGRALLDTMEPGALYFPASDHSTFAVLYWQGVEGYGTGVVVADKYGVVEQAVRAAILEPEPEDEGRLDALPGSQRRRELERLAIDRWTGPVFFANRRDMSDLKEWVQEPVGPLFQIMRRPEAEAWWAPPEGGAAPRGVASRGAAPRGAFPGGGEGTPGRSPGLAIWDRFERLLQAAEGCSEDFTEQLVGAELRYMHGFALARSGDLEAAQAAWGSIESDLAPVKQLYNNIGSALAEHGRTGEALSYYGRALAEDEDYVLALRNQARVHIGRGELGHAVATLRTVLAVAPKLREERLELARLLGRQDEVVESLGQYEQLARRDRRDPLPWQEAGDLLERVGDLRKAKQAFEESLRLDSSQVAVARKLDRLRRGLPHLHEPGMVDPAGAPPDPLAALVSSGAPTAGVLFPQQPDPPVPLLPASRESVLPGTPQPPSPGTGLPATGLPRRPTTGERP